MTTKKFLSFGYHTIAVQTLTYTIAGILASTFLDYGERFTEPPLSYLMRPIEHPLVMAGPLFQPLRGLIFALALVPFYQVIFRQKLGWLWLWGLFLGFSILSPVSAAPGSIEGMIYTVLPIKDHVFGWPEVVLQTLTFCLLLYYWENHPEKKWLTWLMTILFVIVLLLPVMGLLFGGAA